MGHCASVRIGFFLGLILDTVVVLLVCGHPRPVLGQPSTQSSRESLDQALKAFEPATTQASIALSAAQSPAVWLKTGRISLTDSPSTPQLTREILRQAVLIAARDGLGLQTRDAS